MESCLKFITVVCVMLFTTATSQTVVEELPGYNGTLPFKLETGYIGVGENEEVQMFYYFIESETDPNRDPLMLWLTGGPGCSGFSGLIYENLGPLSFDLADFDGSLPNFILNPYSWTKIASIIFIDSPAGTGFSYSTTPEGYNSSDTKSAKYSYMFLRKFLGIHPEFLKNRLYITGDSYGGKIVPMVALEIAQGNEAGLQPRMLLQGYTVGNSLTDENQDKNQAVPYMHRVALISDEYYELAKKSCDGEYFRPDPNNIECIYALTLISQCTNNVFDGHILEPKCTRFMTPKPNKSPLMEDDLLFLSTEETTWCRNYNYISSYVWANDENVQEALGIRKGTKTDWKRCNKTLTYNSDVKSVLKHHKLLNEKGFQALAYSGDHDMDIPYLSTLKWIRQLNLSLDDNWRPWNVDGQVAGYTERYKNVEAYLTFATVKGAGHTAPEYKPKECFAMIQRWIGLYAL